MRNGAAGVRRAFRPCYTLVCFGLMLAGCTAHGGPLPTAATQRAPTVAFESIDGPPPAVFNRLVDTLSAEAEARRIAVVSREAPSTYRVRGYLAAHVDRGRTHIGWVWDVYDAERRRTLRISGEEPGSPHRAADAWSAADEPLLRRIAQASLDRLVAFLAAS